MRISRDPDKGFQVPHSWVAGNCGVYIDLADETPDAVVLLPLTMIVRVTLLIMGLCLEELPALGGTAVLKSKDGNGGLLEVVVIGRNMPYLVDPPPWWRAAAALGEV